MIFLSHAAVDAELAKYLEQSMRESSPDVDVFRTSRSGQIPSGRPWFDHISSHLAAADRYALLLTPLSQHRPWVCFEAGAAFQTGRILVPILAAGLTHAALVEPLRNLQTLSLEDEQDAAQIFQDLGIKLEDSAGFVERARQIGKLSASRALEAQGWEQVEVDSERFAWDGPIDDLKQSFGVPLPDALTPALNAVGMSTQFGIEGDLSNEFSQGLRQVWKINVRLGRRHPVVGPWSQVLLVRPTGTRR